MVTGWILQGDDWYFAENSGAIVTGWRFVNGAWYWLEPSDKILLFDGCNYRPLLFTNPLFRGLFHF